MKNKGKIILIVLGAVLIGLGGKTLMDIPAQKAVLENAVYLDEPVVLPENEGKLVIAVERNAAEQVLAALHSHPLGKDAALIGEVVERKGVRLAGLYGVKRTLDLPHAEPLPRIC